MIFVFVFAEAIRGSKRWIDVGPIQFQPSEFGKGLFVLALAGFLVERRAALGQMRTVLAALALAAVPTALVFLQPDLGTALVYGAAVCAVLFVAGVRWLHLAILAVVGATVVLGVLWFLPAAGIEVLKPYQTARLTGFTNPDADPAGLTYNVRQSITAVGAGGLEGRGVIEASQTRFDYLPEHATDFVFASFAEQRGFFGAAILLLLYLLVVWRGLRVVTVAGDLYGAMVAAGIVFAFLFQVFVNVGMTMGIAPVTGIPLPFVTVGGSSMVANLVAIGLLQGIHARGRTTDTASPMKLPLTPRHVLALGRDTQAARAPRPPILVRGVLADQLAAALRAGGDPSLVRTAGDPAAASAVVCVVAGAATPEDERVLRTAARALVPLVAVQTGDPAAPLPYVLATEVVDCRPGAGFPVEEIAQALARVLRRDGPVLARSLPVLRDPVESRRAVEGAVAAASLAALGRAASNPHLPLISQARMLSDIATAEGAAPPEAPRASLEAVAPPLALSLATSAVVGQSLRRLPVRHRLLDAVAAGLASLGVAMLYRRVAARLP